MPGTTSGLQVWLVMMTNKVTSWKDSACQVRKMMSDLLAYTKKITSQAVSKLEEEDVKGVVRSLTDSETPEMILNQGDSDDNSDNDDFNTEEKVSIDKMVKLCDELDRLEQHAFITEQEIMPMYKIKERLLRQKAIQYSASSSLEHPLLGPSFAFDVPPRSSFLDLT